MKFFLLIFVFASGTALAQSSARFTITRDVVAGGGTTFSASNRFQLGSTIAQPLAAVPASTRFTIQGGFWIWDAPIIFAPTKIGNDFVLSFQTEPGKTYLVEYTVLLLNPNWRSLPLVIGDGTTKSVTNSAPAITQEYYRLSEH